MSAYAESSRWLTVNMQSDAYLGDDSEEFRSDH